MTRRRSPVPKNTNTSYAHRVPHDIPQPVDPESIQRASEHTAGDKDEPLLKRGDPLVTAKLQGSPKVRKYREAHARALETKRLGKLAKVAETGRTAERAVEDIIGK